MFILPNDFSNSATLAISTDSSAIEDWKTNDAKVAAENADLVAEMAKLPWAAFGPGTDKAGIPTRAKAEIWAEQAKFKDLSDKMIAETTKLTAAAKSGNADALKTAFGATGASCKACHDNYQAKL